MRCAAGVVSSVAWIRIRQSVAFPPAPHEKQKNRSFVT